MGGFKSFHLGARLANNVIGLKAAKHIIIARLSIFSIARESVGITAGLIIDDVVPPCVFRRTTALQFIEHVWQALMTLIKTIDRPTGNYHGCKRQVSFRNPINEQKENAKSTCD